MALSPEIKKLARQALKITDSEVPLHRALDILATSEGNIFTVINQYRDIKDAHLRKALHYCAELLRAVEAEAGLTPAWEAALRDEPARSSGAPARESAAEPAPAAAPSRVKKKNGFGPEDLKPFIDETMRGKVRVAKAYVDGASKGNPGESGIGVALFNMEGQKIAQESRAIGVATNNIAEYSALIEAMKIASRLDVKVLNVIGDSELMVKQVSGVYKIKNPEIFKKVQEVMALKRQFEKFSINYVPRENNTLADALSTQMIPTKKGGRGGGGGRASQDFLGAIDPNADDGATG